jgi:dolichol kinase
MPPSGLWEPPNWLSDVVTERSESSPASTISQAPTSVMGNNEGGPLGGLTLPTGTNVSNVATDLLDAADKHVPTLSLNARRKFFHGLAMVMFLPGVLIDVSFYVLIR